MKTGVIPDVHHRIEVVDKIMAREKGVDQWVFLGDLYDDFGDTPLIAGETARWHKKMLERDDVVFCMGNHDMPYRFRNPFLLCSGWEWPKHQVIAEIVTPADWNKHVLFVNTQGWLLSHAGVNPRFYNKQPPVENNKALIIPHHLHNICVQAIQWVREGKRPPLLGAGYYRGGDQAVGGITWQDWNGEFEPVEGLKQIVGHTPGKEPRWKGDNLCLDTHLRHYAVIVDGKVEIRES